jgi:hypothetical protein
MQQVPTARMGETGPAMRTRPRVVRHRSEPELAPVKREAEEELQVIETVKVKRERVEDEENMGVFLELDDE